MWLGGFLTVVGLVLMVVGVRAALGRPRPVNLGGALLAPAGLIVAFIGVVRLLG